MIDSGEGVTDQDKKIASLVIERGKGLVLVLNKWDALEPMPNLRNAIEDRVRFLFPILEFAPIVPLSALKGEGVEELMATLIKVWRQLNKKVDTPKINKAMKEWNEHYSPPRDKRSIYRVRYVTQIGVNPIKFLLFVNRKKGFPAGWIQYLVNRIRKDFGYSLVPVSIELRER
jgi:GTP-binding protein